MSKFYFTTELNTKEFDFYDEMDDYFLSLGIDISKEDRMDRISKRFGNFTIETSEL